MAASKPTYWLFKFFNFLIHLNIFRDLNKQSGLFPSRPWILAPKVCLLNIIFFCIRSLIEFSKALHPPSSLSALPQKKSIKRST